MNVREFQQSQYFDNVLVSTIRFLESLPAKSPNEKSQFLRGLQRVLPEFPVSVLERKLLGALMDELKDRELLPLILQNVFGILQRIPNGRRVFPEKIIPRLKEVFGTGSGKAAAERDSKKDAGLMVVLENMKAIANNCSGMEFKDGKTDLLMCLNSHLTYFDRYFTSHSARSGFTNTLFGRCLYQMPPRGAPSSRFQHCQE
jgi:SCY1-like protein 2